MPVLEYLCSRFTYLEPEEWAMRVAEGRISCDGKVCTRDTQVSGGMIIVYDVPEFEEPEADLGYSVIYEDEWILGVNKPGNLLVHRAGKAFRGNLMYQLRYCHVPPFVNANAVTRLDRETSGVIVIAKDIETVRLMNAMFAKGEVNKTYLAVVCGIPNPPSGNIDLPICKDENGNTPSRFRIAAPGIDEKFKDAHTVYSTERTLGNAHALLDVRPQTGRTHQIRVHLSAAGYPIYKDKVYGKSVSGENEHEQIPIIKRQALHCHSLEFVHVRTGKTCMISASVPDDMQNLIKNLGNSSGSS
jgi:RluA family pseudouridine synthase